MDSLPIEITYMIFAHFKGRPRDIAHLRLVCKTFAAISLHYLVPELHLIFKPSSFKHLREISEHPVISQHVETLFYEADTLTSYENRRQRENHIIVPGWLSNTPDDQLLPPPATASEREQRAYHRNMEKLRAGPRYTNSEKEMKTAYEKYQKCLSDQNKMRGRDYNAEAIKKAMVRLPNLKNIALSMECCPHEERSAKLGRAFAKGYQPAYGDDVRKESCGVPQMRSLLLGANHAGLKLDRLCCGNVHWEFFKQTEVDFAEMKYADRYLTLLNMHVTTRTSDEDLAEADGDDYDSQIPACADFLKGSGRMRDFFTAAPALRTLDISFDCENPHPPAGLKEMVGDITWHSLHYAAFNVLQTTEDELMHFYTRHAGILCGITLDTIKLTKGSWPCLLQRIRKTLSLKKAMICGHVTSSDPEEDFDFDLPPVFNNGVRSLPGRAVEKYLMLGGDGSLLDLNALGEDEAFKPESDWHEMFMT